MKHRKQLQKVWKFIILASIWFDQNIWKSFVYFRIRMKNKLYQIKIIVLVVVFYKISYHLKVESELIFSVKHWNLNFVNIKLPDSILVSIIKKPIIDNISVYFKISKSIYSQITIYLHKFIVYLFCDLS